MSQAVAHRIFAVEEYYRMQQAGILHEDDRVELIDGEIMQMSPISSRHAACVGTLLNAFIPLQAAKRVLLRAQDPIRLGAHSEPQPDLVLAHARPDFYAQAHPQPKDIILVVEVADTSARYDRETKMPLYARAGIAEAWLVDLEGGYVEIFRDVADGSYRNVSRAMSGERIQPQAFPDLSIDTSELLR